MHSSSIPVLFATLRGPWKPEPWKADTQIVWNLVRPVPHFLMWYRNQLLQPQHLQRPEENIKNETPFCVSNESLNVLDKPATVTSSLQIRIVLRKICGRAKAAHARLTKVIRLIDARNIAKDDVFSLKVEFLGGKKHECQRELDNLFPTVGFTNSASRTDVRTRRVRSSCWRVHSLCWMCCTELPRGSIEKETPMDDVVQRSGSVRGLSSTESAVSQRFCFSRYRFHRTSDLLSLLHPLAYRIPRHSGEEKHHWLWNNFTFAVIYNSRKLLGQRAICETMQAEV